jgi:hypothetical protein
MNIWKLIERDHEYIGQLVREIPYALNDPGVVGGREHLLSELMDRLDLHDVALSTSLYAPLGREETTQTLVEDLRRGHAAFMRELRALARRRRSASAGWLDTFEDVTFLVDQHLHRLVHELLPAARKLLSPEAAQSATRDFIRTKTRVLEARRRAAGRTMLADEAALISMVTVLAAALGYLVWRGGRGTVRSRATREG